MPLTPQIPGHETLRLILAGLAAYGREPECITIDPSGDRVDVGLQAANGLAVQNLRTQAFDHIFNLGLKDLGLPGNEVDPSDRDGRLEVRSVPVMGLYPQDTVAGCTHAGRHCLVLANEGDALDNGDENSEDERRTVSGSGDTKLSDVPDLARLNPSSLDSARGGPLVKFGGHSNGRRQRGRRHEVAVRPVRLQGPRRSGRRPANHLQARQGRDRGSPWWMAPRLEPGAAGT